MGHLLAIQGFMGFLLKIFRVHRGVRRKSHTMKSNRYTMFREKLTLPASI